MSLRILVTLPLTQDQLQEIQDIAPGAKVTFFPQRNVNAFSHLALTKEHVQDANIILGSVPVDFVRGSENLQWIQLNSAGAGGFTDPGVLGQGVPATNATGGYGLAISEHMLGMMLALMKRLHLFRDYQNQALWLDEGVMVQAVEDATVLTIGLGDIGGNFARKCKALGAHTIGIRRTNADKPDWLDEQYTLDALDTLLPRADVVAMSLPDTAHTVGLMTRERIALMKHSAYLLNVGRGSAIDTEALCDALEQNAIAGAGLEVTDPEPLPPEHRLWREKNALITPHVSGGYHMRQTQERIFRIAADNLRRFLAGQPLEHLLDPATGYAVPVL